ncbi:ribonuclease P protein component, partial [Halomonas sp. MG34]|nr:ribonuclease P protein component [Halomonas sp. MG34]
KRYLRQAFQEMDDRITYPHDIVIIARQQTKKMSYEEIKKSLNHLLYKERLLKK